MKFFSRHSIQFKSNFTKLLIIVCALAVANALFWATHLLKPLPKGSLFSSGVAFMADGTELEFSDKLTFRDEHINYAVRVKWNNKSNTMQEAGVAKRGLLGQIDITLEKTTSFGPSLLSEVALEEEFAFDRSYMQGGLAEISLLPLSGRFQKFCFYAINMNKVHCGTSIRSTFLPQHN